MNPKNKLSEVKFPPDIAQKGNEMTGAYFKLYLIENFLRLFIEKVAITNYGEIYIGKLKIGANINKKIQDRKKDEINKKWLSVRGDSDLFYTDLIDLKTIISSNWKLFESYFPKELWISSKLEELYDLRIKVAHNSYLDQHEQNTLNSIINSIYRQLSVDLKFKVKKDLKIKKQEPSRISSNLFLQFQNLVYSRNFRKVISKWRRFYPLFLNDAFHVNKTNLMGRGVLIDISCTLDNSRFYLSYDPDNIYYQITSPAGEIAKLQDKNFDNIEKQFFENIKDLVN